MKTFRPVLFALLSSVALYACGGGTSSSADTGLTQSQVQGLIAQALAPVQQQVSALQTQVNSISTASPAVFIRAPNAPAVKVASMVRGTSSKATSTTTTCTGLGTLTGRPSNSDPISSSNISGVSCTGYYYTVSGAATSADTAYVQPLQGNLTVWFDAPACAGNAYVTVTPNGGMSLSEGALANGAVFTAAGSYWMLKPGTASSQPTLLSQYSNGQCNTTSVSGLIVYPLAPNDQTVSGVPSAPIPGPVTIG